MKNIFRDAKKQPWVNLCKNTNTTFDNLNKW